MFPMLSSLWFFHLRIPVGIPWWLSGKESACQCRGCRRCGFDSWMWADSLEKATVTHSSTLAWEIPWTEEPGGLQSMELELDMTDQLNNNYVHYFLHLYYSLIICSYTIVRKLTFNAGSSLLPSSLFPQSISALTFYKPSWHLCTKPGSLCSGHNETSKRTSLNYSCPSVRGTAFFIWQNGNRFHTRAKCMFRVLLVPYIPTSSILKTCS